MPINIVQISGPAASGKTLLADAVALGMRDLNYKHLRASGNSTARGIAMEIQAGAYHTIIVDDCSESLLAKLAAIDVPQRVTIYAITQKTFLIPAPEPKLGNLIVSLMAKRLKGLLTLGSWGRAA